MLRELKLALNRTETYFVIAMGVLIAFLGILFVYLENSSDPPSAYQASLVGSGTVAQLFSTMILPVFCVLAYTDCYFIERNAGVAQCAISRQGRGSYFFNKAGTVAIMAFVLTIIPYLLNLIYSLIAYDTEYFVSFFNGDTAYDQHWFLEAANFPSPLLYINNQGLLTIACILYAGVCSVVIAIMSYAINLYFNKNRVLCNLIPVALCIVWEFVGSQLLGHSWVPSFLISNIPLYRMSTWSNAWVVLGVVFFISLGAIACKVWWRRDEIV